MTDATGYPAETRTTVRPEMVDATLYGHHKSYPRLDGTRLWTFEIEHGRDAFLSAYNAGAFRKPESTGENRNA